MRLSSDSSGDSDDDDDARGPGRLLPSASVSASASASASPLPGRGTPGQRIRRLQEKLAKARRSKQTYQTRLSAAVAQIRDLEQQESERAALLDQVSRSRVVELEAELCACRADLRRLREKKKEGEGEDGDEAAMTTKQKEKQKQLRAKADVLTSQLAEAERKQQEAERTMLRQGERLRDLEALYKKEMTLRKRYFNHLEDLKGKIRVYVRVRPLLDLERGQGNALSILDEGTSVAHPGKAMLDRHHMSTTSTASNNHQHHHDSTSSHSNTTKVYDFDRVFGPDDGQDVVFEDVKHLMQSAVDGFNVCIFAYGQTGSGKTHTIYGGGGGRGSPTSPGDDNDNAAWGLCPRGVHELYRVLDEGRALGRHAYTTRVQLLELYQDTLVDLLALPLPKPAVRGHPVAPVPLVIKQDAKGVVTVQGAVSQSVTDAAALMAVIHQGVERRTVSSTKMNRASSRSHLIISILVETTQIQTGVVSRGKLNFVDLAGSERLKKSGSVGTQQKEATAINVSLSALGDVIAALASSSGGGAGDRKSVV